MKAHTTITDVLMDINTPDAAKKFIVITDHENSFYFSYPEEDEFTSLKGQAFLTRTFIPFTCVNIIFFTIGVHHILVVFTPDLHILLVALLASHHSPSIAPIEILMRISFLSANIASSQHSGMSLPSFSLIVLRSVF